MLYDNTIDELLWESRKYEIQNHKSPIFISDWNPSEKDIIPVELHKSSDENPHFNNYTYLYSIDDVGYKNKFYDFCKNFNHDLGNMGFSLFSNATIALYITFKYLATCNIKNILVFSPCYFTSESALKSLGYHITYYPVISAEDFDFERLVCEFTRNMTQAILITDPIFGTGVSFGLQFYKTLIQKCKQLDIKIIIDYAYGNMLWNERTHIINWTLLSMLNSCDCFLIDSLPKKLFLNGSKFSLLYANSKDISIIEKIALFIEGAFSAVQFKSYYDCYDLSNIDSINKIINRYIDQAKKTFRLLKAFLIDREDCQITASNSSIFSLIGIPRHSTIEYDLQYAQRLIRDYGIFLTPHSRYHFTSEKTFFFRVNLLKSSSELLESLSIILRK